jgi:NAD(P)H dehydrogenase (quinone)
MVAQKVSPDGTARREHFAPHRHEAVRSAVRLVRECLVAYAVLSQSTTGDFMAKVLVLYYSSYGHIETMAGAVAEGARQAGATVDLKRVPETAPLETAKAAHFKLEQSAPIATIEDLADYDAIIVGTPTRFGRMASQMASFLDQAGGLWMRGALNGKVGGAFTSTGSQHGGQETTLFSIITNLLHFGMTIVGLPYSFQGQMTLDEISGGSPYGAISMPWWRAPSSSLALG